MKNQAIGVFDSGVGGLTVANAVAKLLPNEKIVYFGDTYNFPYGEKSGVAVAQYCRKISQFLMEQNCKAIIVACNTASSHISHRQVLDIVPPEVPFINVIDPVVNKIKGMGLQKIGVIATKSTTNSRLYELKLQQQIMGVEVVPKATRSLAAIIEEGLHRNPQIIVPVIEHYLSDPAFKGIEGLILGCTHYPVIKDEIAAYFNHKVTIFDSPQIIADHLAYVLSENDLLNDQPNPKHHFYLSDFTQSFEDTARFFFEEEVRLEEFRLWG